MALNVLFVVYVVIIHRRSRRSRKALVFLEALEETLRISGAQTWSLTSRRGSITVPSTVHSATERLQRANWLRGSAFLSDFIVTMSGYEITSSRISVTCEVVHQDAPFSPVNSAGEHHISLFEVVSDDFEIDADEAKLRLPHVVGEEVELTAWYSADRNVTKTSALLNIDSGLYHEWRNFRHGFTSAPIRWARSTANGTKLHLAL